MTSTGSLVFVSVLDLIIQFTLTHCVHECDVFTCFLFTCVTCVRINDDENRVMGPLRSLKMSPLDRAHIDVLQSLWLYLVSFLRYSMSKNVVTLKSGSEVTQSH